LGVLGHWWTIGVWPTQNVIISQLVDSIIEDNLIVNVLNEAFHAQANTLRLPGGLDHQGAGGMGKPPSDVTLHSGSMIEIGKCAVDIKVLRDICNLDKLL